MIWSILVSHRSFYAAPFCTSIRNKAATGSFDIHQQAYVQRQIQAQNSSASEQRTPPPPMYSMLSNGAWCRPATWRRMTARCSGVKASCACVDMAKMGRPRPSSSSRMLPHMRPICSKLISTTCSQHCSTEFSAGSTGSCVPRNMHNCS